VKLNKQKFLSLNFIIYFAYASCAILTVIILYQILKYSAYGFDFTDEGYYLNQISNPFLYKASVSNYGFIYHPFYIWFNGNISLLRKINFLITFFLAYALAFIFFKSITTHKKNIIFDQIIILGIASNIFLSIDIFTPNYNSLNLQALIILSLGIFLIDKKKDTQIILSYACIGIGGWLTFMAKPSSALALTFVVLIYLILSKKFTIRLIIISSLITLFFLLLSAIIVSGSVSKFIQEFIKSITLYSQIDHGIKDTFLRTFILIHKTSIKYFQIFYTFLSFILIFIFSLFIINLKKINKIFILLIIFLSIFIIMACLIFNVINTNMIFGVYLRLQILGIIFACLFINLVFTHNNKIKKIRNSYWRMAFFLALLPYVYAFGTNINYLSKALDCGIFWILAAFILLIPLITLNDKKYISIIFLILITQLITYSHLQAKFETPSRQNQPLRLNSSLITINNKNDVLILSKEFATYILNARNISNKGGFVKGDSIIDLSGQSPGLLYLLNATAIGTAWNIGGYPKSLEVSKTIYNSVSCKDISKSWILYENKGPRSVSADLMISLGANFPEQYQYIGSWKTATGAGGYEKIRIQKLYKPKTNTILQSCNILRNKKIKFKY
jgi:hypothetical protein